MLSALFLINAKGEIIMCVLSELPGSSGPRRAAPRRAAPCCAALRCACSCRASQSPAAAPTPAPAALPPTKHRRRHDALPARLPGR